MRLGSQWWSGSEAVSTVTLARNEGALGGSLEGDYRREIPEPEPPAMHFAAPERYVERARFGQFMSVGPRVQNPFDRPRRAE
jgi:hypothetical protein